MSRYFCDDPPVPIAEFDPATTISDVPPNIIVIRARMDVGTRGKVQSELLTLGDGNQLEARLGENITALLIHNIVGWSGPDFDTVPCDAAHIRMLDANEPHVARVIAEITTRNTAREAPGKNPAASADSMSAGEPGLSASPAPSVLRGRPSRPSASGMSMSVSPSDSAGLPTRSTD